jgi:signal transduction histidine kinase
VNTRSTLSGRSKWIAAAALTVAAFLLNLLPVSLSPGIHWLFGGVAYLLAAAALGPAAGLAAAVPASALTWTFWNHPWAWLIFSLEGFTVGYLVHRWNRSPLGSTAIFWAVLGTPLLILFYYGVMGVAGTTLSLIALKQPLNALVNAAIVEAFLLIPLVRRTLRIPGSSALRSALSTVTFVTAIGAAMVFGVWAGRREWDRSVTLAAGRVELLARSYTSKLEQYVHLHQQAVRSLASAIGSQADLGEERLQRLLSGEADEFPGFLGLVAVDLDGQPLATYPDGAADILSQRLLLRTAFLAQLEGAARTVVSDVVDADAGALSTVLIGHPLLSPDGIAVGYLIGGLDLRRLPEPILRPEEPERLRVFDRWRRIVIDQQPAANGGWASVEELPRPTEPGVVIVETPAARIPATRVAAQVLVGYAPLEGLGWLTTVEHPFSQIEAAVATPYRRLLFLLFILVGVAGVLSTFLARWMAAPLLRLRWAAGAVGSGQRDVRVRSLPAAAPTELVELARSFDQMADVLAERAEELEELSEIARSLASTLETEPLLRQITDAAVRLISADGCGIALLVTGKEELRAEAHSTGLLEPAAGREIPLQGSLVGWVVRHARPVRITRVDPALTLYRSGIELERIGSVISSPLIGRSGPLGALTAVRAVTTPAFTADDLQLLERLARTAAIAVENARLIETAQSASRAKSDFIAAMSHELRTPLNAVLGHLQLLELEIHGTLQPKQHESLARIGAATRHLRGLIEEVLSFARLEAGRTPVLIAQTNVSELVEEVVAVIEPLAAEKRLTLAVDLPAAPQHARTDPDKVRQILINLAGNAVKFTESGSVQVSLERAERGDGSGVDGALIVHVTDTGPGIPTQDHDRLFRPFEQLDSGLARRYGGTGLGLYLSGQYARMIGARIEVESELGQGSTFSLVIPEDPPEEIAAAAEGAAVADRAAVEGATPTE